MSSSVSDHIAVGNNVRVPPYNFVCVVKDMSEMRRFVKVHCKTSWFHCGDVYSIPHGYTGIIPLCPVCTQEGRPDPDPDRE